MFGRPIFSPLRRSGLLVDFGMHWACVVGIHLVASFNSGEDRATAVSFGQHGQYI